MVFAGLTMADFQRLRRSQGLSSAPLLAASIFLDALNVFLRIFGRASTAGPHPPLCMPIGRHAYCAVGPLY